MPTPDMSHPLQDLIAQLQRKAAHCAWLFQTHTVKPSLQVAYVADAALPWRLLEVHTSRGTVVLKRMHCFRQVEALQQSIEERALWKARERQLLNARLPQGKSPAQLIGAAKSAFEQELAALEPERKALRDQVCVTRPERVITLVEDRPGRQRSPLHAN